MHTCYIWGSIADWKQSIVERDFVVACFTASNLMCTWCSALLKSILFSGHIPVVIIKTLNVYSNAGHLLFKAREKCAVMALHSAFCRTIVNGFSVRGARKSHAELNSVLWSVHCLPRDEECCPGASPCRVDTNTSI